VEDMEEEEDCESTSYGSSRKAAVVFVEGTTAEVSVPQSKVRCPPHSSPPKQGAVPPSLFSLHAT
jgi:hypothetical protein